MNKKEKIVMHPSSAVYLLEKICSFMVGNKNDLNENQDVVGKIIIKPQKQNSPSGKITLIIKKSSSPEDDLRA